MAHKHTDIFENRKEFQLERMILFSDAVFAIAITLLVIDIRLPETGLVKDAGSNNDQALSALHEVTFRLIGFVFSFLIIGQYWVTHHRLFGYITGFDSGLIWLNLLTLFWVVLIPFTTSFNFTYYSQVTWVVYSLNLSMVSFFVYLIWRRISNPKHRLTWLIDDPVRLRYGRMRSIIVTLIFLSGLICLPFPGTLDIAHYLYILIFPAMKIVGRRYEKAKARQERFLAAKSQG